MGQRDFFAFFSGEHPLPMWIYSVDELKILSANAQATQLLGYSEKEFGKMKVGDIRPHPIDKNFNLVRKIGQANDELIPYVSKSNVLVYGKSECFDLTYKTKEAILEVFTPLPELPNKPISKDFVQTSLTEYVQIISESLRLPIMILDKDGKILSTSIRVLENFERIYSSKLKKGLHILDIGLNAVDEKNVRRGLRGEQLSYEQGYFSQGSRVWMKWEIVPLIEGRVPIFMISVQDISIQKKASQELSKMRLVVNRTSNVIIFTDAKGMITWVNPSFEKTTGYTLEDIIGKKPGSILQGPGTNPETIAYMGKCLSEGVGFRTELLNYTKSKREYWVDMEVIPLKNDQGTVIGFMAVGLDITNIKLAISEMLSAKEILGTVMDNAPLHVYVKDNEGRYVFFNREYQATFLQQVVVEDWQKDFEVLNPLDKAVLTGGEKFKLEEAIEIDDEIRNFLTFKFPLKDSHNDTYAVGNVSVDVTELLNAQQALKESEELYFSTVNSISDAVIAIDTEFRINFLNPSAEQLLGYPKEEISAHIFGDVVRLKSEHSDEYYNPLCSQLNTSNMVLDSLWLLSKSGDEVPVEGSVSAVVSSSGDLRGLVLVFKNVSDKLERERLEKDMEVKRLTALIEGQERERDRVSKELHDGLGQMLNLVKMNVDLLTKGKRRDISSLIDETIQETARISENLVPSKLRDFDIETALKSLCNQFRKSSLSDISFDAFGDTFGIDDTVKVNLYRIAQEALNNAIKHSKASYISLALNEDSDRIRLSIEDNGVGIAKESSGEVNSHDENYHHGLTNMRERAKILGADFYIESEKGLGTLIIVESPKIMNNSNEMVWIHIQ